MLPVVVSTFGAWRPEFVRWVRRLLRERAAASAADEAEANGLLGGMLWRVGASLSVAVQRAVFDGLAACLPEVRAGGAPLALVKALSVAASCVRTDVFPSASNPDLPPPLP